MVSTKRMEKVVNAERKPLGEWSNIPYAREATLHGGQMALILLSIALLSLALGYCVWRAVKRYSRNSSLLLPIIVSSLLGTLLLGAVALKISEGSKVDEQENATGITNALEKNYPLKLNPSDRGEASITQGQDFTATVKGKRTTCKIEYKADETGNATEEQHTLTFRPLCK